MLLDHPARGTALLAGLAAVATAEKVLLAEADVPDDLRALVHVALSGPDSVLGGAEEPRWARLPLLACASAGGPDAAAVPLAVGLEMQAAAYSLLDDLEDGDTCAVICQAGPTVALNVATTLLALAQHAQLPIPRPVAAVMVRAWLGACAGQHRDLTLRGSGDDPLGATLLAAGGKTAGITAAALEAGALL